MTATPIPRTLALTVYGDLAVTEIAKPPAIAQADRHGLGRRGALDRGLRAAARAPRRGPAGLRRLPADRGVRDALARAAEEEAERLRRAELAGYRVGLLHGRLKAAERREVMRAFKEGELDVLVATTVIEVGVDVPNATIMIVQEADRFGLAQLHQLRGRVGRGAEQSYCLLISRPKEELTDAAQARLRGARRDDRRLRARRARPRAARRGRSCSARASRGSATCASRASAPTAPLLERARELARELVDEDGPWHDEADRLLAATDPSGLA